MHRASHVNQIQTPTTDTRRYAACTVRNFQQVAFKARIDKSRSGPGAKDPPSIGDLWLPSSAVGPNRPKARSLRFETSVRAFRTKDRYERVRDGRTSFIRFPKDREFEASEEAKRVLRKRLNYCAHKFARYRSQTTMSLFYSQRLIQMYQVTGWNNPTVRAIDPIEISDTPTDVTRH